MGNLQRGREFKRNDAIDGQDKSLLLLAKSIKLRKYELDRIYYEYTKVEDRSTFTIDIRQIMTSNKLKDTLFSHIYFQIFDLNKTGMLNFREYLIVMWSLLTCDDEELARLCWGLFDNQNRGTLDLEEIQYLINLIWDFQPTKKVLKSLAKLEANRDGIVTLREFVLWTLHHKDALHPVRHIRERLGQRTVYRRFWRELMQSRMENFPNQNMFQVFARTDAEYVASSMEYLNLRTDRVPREFVEQWKLVQMRKESRGMVHKELPYEVKEKINPQPLPVVVKAKPKRKKQKSRRYNSIIDDPLFQDENEISNNTRGHLDLLRDIKTPSLSEDARLNDSLTLQSSVLDDLQQRSLSLNG